MRIESIFLKYPILWFEKPLTKKAVYVLTALGLVGGVIINRVYGWQFPFTNRFYLGAYGFLRGLDGFTTLRVSRLLGETSKLGLVTDLEEKNPLFSAPPSLSDLLSFKSMLAQFAGLGVAICFSGLGITVMGISLKASVSNWRIGDRLHYAKQVMGEKTELPI